MKNTNTQKVMILPLVFHLFLFKYVKKRYYLTFLIFSLLFFGLCNNILQTKIFFDGSDYDIIYDCRADTKSNDNFTRYDAAINYVKSCYDKISGGFKSVPEIQSDHFNRPNYETDLMSTYTGSYLLFVLNETNSLDYNRIKNWFKRYFRWGYWGPSGAKGLFSAYSILKLIDGTDILSQQEWTDNVLYNWDEERGFLSHEAGFPSPRYSFFSYKLLESLDKLDCINWTKVTDFVMSWRLPNGCFAHPLVPTKNNVGETVYAYSYLNATNQLNLINQTKIFNCLNERFESNVLYGHSISNLDPYIAFSIYNGYPLREFSYSNVVLSTVNLAQLEAYGNFPTFWYKDEWGTLSNTATALFFYYYCNDLSSLKTQNITVNYPPLEFTHYLEEFLLLLSPTIILFISFILIVIKRKNHEKAIDLLCMKVKE